jgi:hypothetical protein
VVVNTLAPHPSVSLAVHQPVRPPSSYSRSSSASSPSFQAKAPGTIINDRATTTKATNIRFFISHSAYWLKTVDS